MAPKQPGCRFASRTLIAHANQHPFAESSITNKKSRVRYARIVTRSYPRRQTKYREVFAIAGRGGSTSLNGAENSPCRVHVPAPLRSRGLRVIYQTADPEVSHPGAVMGATESD